ncbi:MAG: RraA family protein [Clostridia bacterium]|nr:RraA family protein [Clostridia bacterium]
MKLGNRSFEQFERAPRALVELFRGIPIANIADNMGRISCVDQGIKPMNKECHILGVAFTVKECAGDNLMFHKALDMFQPGDVLVIDGNGCMERSQCGEIMSTYAYKRGCAGIVIDGVIRDLAGIRKLPLPIYARGVQANGPFKNGPGEIGVPVPIGGIVIYPGDIIVSDEDGLLAIRPHEAEELAKLARATFESETRLLEHMRETGEWDRKVFRDAVTNSGVEIIDEAYRYC